MQFDVLTLFPEMFEPVKQSILGRAEKENLIRINLINIRDFSKDKHKKVDDSPYRRRRWNGNKTRCCI